VHSVTEEESDCIKDSFYEELEHVYYQFPKYNLNILLGDFNAQVGRDDIFKPTHGNVSLLKNINDNEVRVINFAASKTRTVKSKIFSHHNTKK
jgi:hypothetical protein